MSNFKNRVVVVTGASSGVGREAALGFAHRGAALVLTARRRGALERVASQCRKSAAAVLLRAADPADPAAVQAIASDVHHRFGRIDVWVNTASVNMLAAERFPDNMWRRRVEQRLFGTYHGVRTVLPYLRSQGEGTIIDVPSVLSRPGPPFRLAFMASKDAVRAVTYCLRREAAGTPGIQVNTVVPGPNEPAVGDEPDDAAFAPLRPVLDPRLGARAVLSCASGPEGEVVVSTHGRLTGLFKLVPGAFDRLTELVPSRDRLAGTLAPTMEHRLIGPDELPRREGPWHA